MKCFFVFGFLALLCLFGCHSDIFYQNEAAGDAANFLVKNCPELTEEQKNFVRYNRPVLLYNQVLTREGGELYMMRSDVKQICVTWEIPGTGKLYMVYGVSDGGMKWWKPVRMVKKNLHNEVPPLKDAVAAARGYAKNYLQKKLTVTEMNQVRFLPPFLCRTDFEVNFDVNGELDEQELILARKAVAGKEQFSLIWRFPGRELVFSGFADGKMSGWNIVFAAILEPAEVAAHTVKVLVRPEDYLKPLPEDMIVAPVVESGTSQPKNVDI